MATDGFPRPGRSTRAREWVVDRWVQWWWLDVPLAAVLVATLALIPRIDPVVDLLGGLNLDDRRSAYEDLLNITTLFAGFSTLATATYLGWSSKGLTAVRSLVGADLLRLWLSATSLPWMLAVVIWIVKLVDRGDPVPTNPARWVAVGCLIVLAEQLVRVLYLFYSLAMIEQKPSKPVRAVAPRSIGMRKTGS